jgi:phosphoribosylformimino-5-aminoimidazole carboxamide ribotide isomerase
MVARQLASAFDIIPAIDLRGGRVVRLRAGDFARETVFSDDPVAVATGFADAGARWLHLVDLDGARDGRPGNRSLVDAIVRRVGDAVAVELAGGLRAATAVDAALGEGVARVVLGTAALADPTFASALVARHGPARVAVAIDIRDGRAVGHGWSATDVGVDPLAAIERLADVGVETFEVTAIDRDGLMAGPDLDLYQRFVDLRMGSIVASAGVRSVDDLVALRTIGCSGAIIGRALYDGSMALVDALRV